MAMYLRKDFHKPLIALLVLSIVVVMFVQWRTGSENVPGDYLVRKANYSLEDGQFPEAIAGFQEALVQNPDHAPAHLGLAVAWLQSGKEAEAMAALRKTIELDPKMTVAYANLGILHDRRGEYQKALDNYKKALSLDQELLEGPGFLWRFMRNIDKKLPTIADRAGYLEAELKKPVGKRLLSLPEKDAGQPMHKVEH